MNKFHIPHQLNTVRSFLLQSSVGYTALIPQNTPHPRHSSIIGAIGYAPEMSNIPRDILGNKMQLLAQINFSHIDAPASFPKKGLLQFYVANHCLEHKQHFRGVLSPNNYKIIYIEQPQLVEHSMHEEISKSAYHPIKQPLQLLADNGYEPVSIFDYRYDEFIPSTSRNLIEVEDFYEFDDVYLQHYSGAQHKIGGYPYFIQQDLRKHSMELQNYDTLLLQIISDDEKGIMWGDCGVIKFFINYYDLLQLHFDRAIMYVEDYT